MKKWLIVLTVFVSGTALTQDLAASFPTAQSFVPEANQSFYLDLDTAEGAFSQWRHDDISSVSALRAVVRVPILRKDRKWLPGFAIWLQKTEAGEIKNRVGVQLVAPDKKPPLMIRLVQYDGKNLVHTESSSTTIGLDQNLAIEIVWVKPHTVTIKIGDAEIHNLSIGWSVNSVGVTASTGQMKVDPLVLGNSHENP